MATPVTQPSYPSSSLYVGDLTPDVTETTLFELFNKIGTVVSIRVCRDNVTKRSLGYAYVNFLQQADAERAIDTLNGTPIRNRACRVMWSQRDPSGRKSNKGNIFIKNLDKSITHKQLYDTFLQFGSILSCKIALDQNNESKGFGFIQFTNPESADKAIASVNNMLLEGKQVFVGNFVSRKERQLPASALKFTNVYVKDLPLSIDDDKKLAALFEPYGKIQNAKLSIVEGKSKGFGFVNMEDPDAAKAAVEGLNGKKLDGAEKPLFAGRAQKKDERQRELKAKFDQMKMEQMTKYQGVNLYVKNLDDDVNTDKLREMFAPFGNVTNTAIMTDDSKTSKGFGFVCFSTPEEATKAVTEMNGKTVGNKPLYVALAQRKEVRKAQLEAQFAQRKQMQIQNRMNNPMYASGMNPMNANNQFYGLMNPAPMGMNPGMPSTFPNFMFPYFNPYGNPANASTNSAGPGVSNGTGNNGSSGANPGAPGGVPNNNAGPQQVVGVSANPGVSNRGGRGGYMNYASASQQGLNNYRGNSKPRGGAPNTRGGIKKNYNYQGNMNNSGVPAVVNNNVVANNSTGVSPVQNNVAANNNTGATSQLSAAFLNSVAPDEQKRILGDELYPKIEAIDETNAPKITGMILEGSSVEDCLNMIFNQSALQAKVNEAMNVLKESGQV